MTTFIEVATAKGREKCFKELVYLTTPELLEELQHLQDEIVATTVRECAELAESMKKTPHHPGCLTTEEGASEIYCDCNYPTHNQALTDLITKLGE